MDQIVVSQPPWLKLAVQPFRLVKVLLCITLLLSRCMHVYMQGILYSLLILHFHVFLLTQANIATDNIAFQG